MYNLSPMNWKDTQLIYHALARMNEECLILTSTREPYACIGFAQDMKKELDLDYCNKNGIGYFRRETGGGTVYLDGNQIFYQLIIRRDNPLAPRLTDAFFRKFMEPVVKVLQNMDLNAEFVPLNDILVEGKIISGNGGGEIGDCKVLVGNILLDFDFKRMASILNVPNEEFRERVLASMQKNLTTLKAQLGNMPLIQELRNTLIKEYEKLMGSLNISNIDKDALDSMSELDNKFTKEEWLFQKVPKKEGRDVKIREGVQISYKEYNTKDWRADFIFEVEDKKIRDLEPANSMNLNIQFEKLRSALIGVTFKEKEIINTINRFYEIQGKNQTQ